MDKTQHWTNHWEQIAEQIARRPNLLLASDYDGTLAPIARTPLEAILPGETRTLLRRIAGCPSTHLAIVSGRALSDVQMHVGLPSIFYAGNHGLELSGPGILLHSPSVLKAHGDLAKAIAFLVETTTSFEGVFIEDKGATAAVHWRLASEASRQALEVLIQTVAASFPRLRIAAGKCVWELRPKEGWNKGHAVIHFATRLGLAPEDIVYLGDDVTDEDAFRAVNEGWTFHVGKTGDETAAHYRISDPADVQAFLLCLLGVRSGRPWAPTETSPLPMLATA